MARFGDPDMGDEVAQMLKSVADAMGPVAMAAATALSAAAIAFDKGLEDGHWTPAQQFELTKLFVGGLAHGQTKANG